MEKLSKVAEEHPLHKGLYIHPYSHLRIEKMKELLQKCEKGGYLGDAAYQAAMAPIKKTETVYTLLQLGSGAILEKKGQQALEIAGKALLIDPTDSKAYLLKGRALRQCNRNAEALKAFNTSIQFDSSHYEVFLERGKLYLQLDEYENALKDFEECLVKVPSAAAYYYMGQCYEKLGKREKAIASLQEISHTSTVYGSHSLKLLRSLGPPTV
jgi:tetratricopeptide (TPR) repeat protein